MKSKIKCRFNKVFFAFVTLWADFWLVLFPWAMQKTVERGYAVQIGNSPKEAQDRVNRYSEDYRREQEFWKFPNIYWHARSLILVWIIFFPIDLYVFCRGLAIYFVWAHPYINFEGIPIRRRRVV
jgi:hypothetical protein